MAEQIFMWILPLDKKDIILLMTAIIGFALAATAIKELISLGVIIIGVSFFLYLCLLHRKAKAEGKEVFI